MEFINSICCLFKVSAPTVRCGDVSNWEEIINYISGPRYFHSSLYRGIKKLTPKLNDIIDYSDCITGWSSDINDCLVSTNWTNPVILVVEGRLYGLNIDNYAILAPIKLKITKIDGQYYFCTVHIDEIPKKSKVKIIINNEFNDIETYRRKNTRINDARNKFLDKLQKK